MRRMKVVGLTDELHDAAEEQCPSGFRAWRMEVEKCTWRSWEDLEMRFPKASRVDAEETHFPLHANGVGVLAKVFFPMNLLILLRIAPAPVGMRPLPRRKISLIQN